jgi:electron transfer flavoprotein alpha subunit
MLMVATAMGKDLAPRIAARKRMALLTDCVSLDADKESFIAVKSMYGGKVFARVRAAKTPVIATLRPSAYPAPPPGESTAAVRTLALTLPAESRARVVEVAQKDEGRPDVQEADIVVTGGRGLKEPENFRMVEELADSLRAAVGASRAAVDAGWIDHAHQVGQTGKTVSPKLYVAIGVSGAIQHLAGMRTSKCILAINKDPEAPIFSIADFGIVGDLFKIVPVLTRELARVKS